MAGNDSSAKGRRAIMFFCGAPADNCTGKKCMDHGKAHSNQAETLACMRNYLLSKGYQQLTPKTFLPPVDPVTGEQGPVLVLNRRAPRVKPGKQDGGYMSQPLKKRPCTPVIR